ncbi:MAG TPA: DUF1059 domain-containing protein [Pseudonocardia sp.]
MMVDCRDVPSDSGCTLAISGERDEVVRAAVAHAIEVHGHTDDPELREAIQSGLRPASSELSSAGAFIQLIDFRTSRIDEVDATTEQWAGAIGAARSARWVITGADREHTNNYVQIVEFPSHEAAMANSDHQATGEFADRLHKLCDGDPTFRNLDIRAATTF